MVRGGYDPFGFNPPRSFKPDPKQERIQELRAQVSEAFAHHQLPQAVKLYLELRAMDPNQVLARQSQLDVANQLFAQELYPAAADAYELFLRQYPKYDQVEQVQLMLGLLYARYLQRPDRAREHLNVALTRLQNSRDVELAREELSKIEASV
jgi:outer membrane protein assembly factor BamD (BamD/ComL family)